MSLINSAMVDLRAENPGVDKYENRIGDYGAADVFFLGNREPQSVVSGDLDEKARRSIGRTLQYSVLDRQSITVGNTRNAVIGIQQATSQLITVAWTLYTAEWTMVPRQHFNNDISYIREFSKNAMSRFEAIADAVEGNCLTALDTAKSQVYADILDYTNVADVITASAAQQDEVLGDLTPIMRANKYRGRMHVLGNAGIHSRVLKIGQHAEFNNQNKTLQLADKTIHYTNQLANAAGNKATGYAIAPGSLGLVFRNEREALAGTCSRTGHEWSVETMPILGFPIDMYYYESVADQSAYSGAATADLTRGLMEHWAVALEVGQIIAYNSDLTTIASPIAKFAITTA